MSYWQKDALGLETIFKIILMYQEKFVPSVMEFDRLARLLPIP